LILLFGQNKKEQRKVKMKSNIREECLIDLGSLYKRLESLGDSRSPQGLRYSLPMRLALMIMAKLSGEDTPSGIAEWASCRGKEIPAALKLLKKLDLREKIVIGDALHTQREASKEVCVCGGDYIWYAKGNQSQMELPEECNQLILDFFGEP
jgi:hypothetical protein